MNITTAIAALALAASALAPAADAAPVTPETATDVHCVGEALPIDSTSLPPTPVCFDTPEEASAYLEGITQNYSRSSASTVVLGTVYENSSYSGSSYTFWGSGACNGATYGFASLSGGWDTRISSARAAGGCWVTLYKATGYGGEKATCTPQCSSIGTLNDQVRSIVFRPEGTIG